MTPDDGAPYELGDSVDGQTMARRAFLRMAAGATIGVPLALAGCGKQTPVVSFQDYAILYEALTLPDLSPPDIVHRLKARAREQGVAASLTTNEEPVRWLSENSGVKAFDPATNSTPPAHGALVVPAVLLDAVEPLLATAMRNGAKVVAYPRPIQHQDAAIVIDAVRAATMLAENAAAWARARLGGRGDMLLVMPVPAPKLGNPWVPAVSAQVQQAIRATLARVAPGLRIVATLHDAYANEAFFAPALAAHPSVRMILTSDDTSALGAARALRARHPTMPRGDLYVGALGIPCVRSRATLQELERNDVLRVIVAAGPQDVANAFIDVPRAVLRGDAPGNVRLPLYVLTPGSSALRSGGYGADYLAHPSPPYYDGLLYDPTGKNPVPDPTETNPAS